MEALERLGLEQNTLIVWTSDNGAPRREPPQGRNGPLSGWGYSTAEGGMRVPCVVRWPGRVPAGTVCREPCLTIDLLPTFAAIAGTHPPADRVIDGRDIRPLLFGAPGATSPHEAIYYYHQEQLQAIRSGPWKLYLPLEEKQELGRTAKTPTPARLFHLIDDLGETKDLASERPDVVRRLTAFADAAREDLGDAGKPGKNQRAAGWVENPTPRVLPRR
jgi:arylsulfatase A-like enzyme